MATHSLSSSERLEQQLKLLYERRSALDRLIESLERYSETLKPNKPLTVPSARGRHVAASRLA